MGKENNKLNLTVIYSESQTLKEIIMLQCVVREMLAA